MSAQGGEDQQRQEYRHSAPGCGLEERLSLESTGPNPRETWCVSPAPLGGQVLPAGEQVVPLPLDEPAVFPREAGVLSPPHLVHRLAEVAHDVELVVDDPGLRGMALLEGGLAEGLPH